MVDDSIGQRLGLITIFGVIGIIILAYYDIGQGITVNLPYVPEPVPITYVLMFILLLLLTSLILLIYIIKKLVDMLSNIVINLKHKNKHPNTKEKIPLNIAKFNKDSKKYQNKQQKGEK